MGISFKEVSHLYPKHKKQYTVAIENINLEIAGSGEFLAFFEGSDFF